MDVSIVLVNYNTKKYTYDCLKSIYEKTSGINFEVIVSDNGSTDGSIEMIKESFPQAVLIENNANLGFGRANNKGKEIAKGKYIFYLNTDTLLLNNAIKEFFDYFEKYGTEKNIGILGCYLMNLDGTFGGPGCNASSLNTKLKGSFIDFLRVTKLSLPLVNRISFSKDDGEKLTSEDLPPEPVMELRSSELPEKTDFIWGADLFMPNNDFAYFDEHYFMYMEEIDMQLQVKRAGKNIEIFSIPQIIHYAGGSSPNVKKVSNKEFYTSFYKINSMISSMYFVKKNFNAPFRVFLFRLFTWLTLHNRILRKKSKTYIKLAKNYKVD